MKSSTSKELGLRPFDITEFLDNDVAITEYLTQVLAEGDHEELLAAIGHVARARGMTDLARQTGLGRGRSALFHADESIARTRRTLAGRARQDRLTSQPVPNNQRAHASRVWWERALLAKGERRSPASLAASGLRPGFLQIHTRMTDTFFRRCPQPDR